MRLEERLRRCAEALERGITPPPISGLVDRRRRKRVVLLATATVSTLGVAVAAFGVTQALDGDKARVTSVAGPHAAPLYNLPDDGWKEGQPGHLALAEGRFSASVTAGGACAWIGDTEATRTFAWPTGYHVRFNPTELIDDQGNVVARDGDNVRVGGGYLGQRPGGERVPNKPAFDTWCGKPGDLVFGVQSEVVRAAS